MSSIISNLEKKFNGVNLEDLDSLENLRFDIEDQLDLYQEKVLNVVGREISENGIVIDAILNNNLCRINNLYTRLMEKIELL